MKDRSRVVFFSILGVLLIFVSLFLFLIYKEANKTVVKSDSSFSVNFIKESYKKIDRENFMISPYSVELALSMLRDGTDGDTYSEIYNVVPKRNIKNLSVYKRVNVANGMFVKDKFKDKVREDYVNLIKNNYNADVVYDEFTSPKIINDWVDTNTYGMIKELVHDLDEEFVLTLVNAVALDEEWDVPFKGDDTHKEKFNVDSNKKINVSMMYRSFDYGVSYYENDKIKSVIMPYKRYDKDGEFNLEDGEQLEFIGILPNDIDDFVSNFDSDLIKEIDSNKKDASNEYYINVSLPKFKFDYSMDDKFKDILNDMGIKSVFKNGANFNKLLDGDEFFVNSAIHKSHVEVDEEGTRAAAVTGLSFETSALPQEHKEVDIKFNKPFVFLIKDTESDEILFFGVVYEPSKYE